jgi:MYXO-CTERM domain-containing protein
VSGYADADGDGFGTGDATTLCDGEGVAAEPGDCDDADDAVFPGADEHCDGRDEDCDGLTDETPVDPVPLFVDADEDGFGVGETGDSGCPLDGYAAVGGDCDDTDATIHPLASEVPYDGTDNDCDGTEVASWVGASTCSHGPGPSGWWALVGLLALRRRVSSAG